MKLIDEIIEILQSEEGKLTEALLKTKVLLHKLGHKELVPWVNFELNGYPDRNDVPAYRILPAQVLVNASNMAYRYTAHHIPLGHLDEEYRKSIETAKMDQSTSVLEEFVRNDEGSLRAHIPMEAYGILGEKLGNGYQIEDAWSEVSYTGIRQILTQVRSRLLDFILELKDQIPDDLNEQQALEKIEKLDTNNLFNNAIFGDNVTIQLGDRSVQEVSNVNLKGDLSSLIKTLKDNGVSEEDTIELQGAIKSDESIINPDKKEFGPAVKGWMSKMLSKAVEASWNIELGVASSVLATALNSYYGWF